MGLGPYPAVGLAEARAERDRWESVLRAGDDPIAARDKQRADQAAAEAEGEYTFKEAAEITFEAKKPGLRSDGKSGKWFSPIRLYLIPAIGGKAMGDITQGDIHAALKPIWRKKHPTAEKAIQRTKIIFEHMRFSGVDCDPFIVDMAKHMLGDVRHTPVPTPAADWRDVPDIFDKLSRPDPSHLCLRFKILTAVRSDGVRGARFDEIKDGVWTVPAERMKGTEGKVQAFRVPLSAAALEVVAEAEKWRRGDFLFPGPRGRPISAQAINKVLNKIDPNITPHGFRTSFRTWVQDTDAAHYDVAETALAHIVGGKVERSYARSDLLERRSVLMEAWGRFVTKQEGAKVVAIR